MFTPWDVMQNISLLRLQDFGMNETSLHFEKEEKRPVVSRQTADSKPTVGRKFCEGTAKISGRESATLKQSTLSYMVLNNHEFVPLP